MNEASGLLRVVSHEIDPLASFMCIFEQDNIWPHAQL